MTLVWSMIQKTINSKCFLLFRFLWIYLRLLFSKIKVCGLLQCFYPLLIFFLLRLKVYLNISFKKFEKRFFHEIKYCWYINFEDTWYNYFTSQQKTLELEMRCKRYLLRRTFFFPRQYWRYSELRWDLSSIVVQCRALNCIEFTGDSKRRKKGNGNGNISRQCYIVCTV